MGVLYIAIGAGRLDGALLLGSGRRARWPEDARFSLPMPPIGGEAALLEAIAAAEREMLACADKSAVCEVRVLVADSWLAQTELPWTMAMRRPAAAQASAATLIELAGFDGDWARPMSLDDAPYGLPRLAVAYPQTLIAGLERLVAALGARLGSVLPFSVAAWETIPRRGKQTLAALAILDRGLLVFAFGSGRLGEVAVRRSPPGDGESARSLRESWRRMCLRRPELAGLKSLTVIALDASAAGAPEAPFEPFDLSGGPANGLPVSLRLAARAHAVRHALDAVPQHPHPSSGTRAALALGAVLLAAMTGQLITNAREIGALATRIDEIRPAPVPVVVEPAWSRGELPRVHAVNAAIRELNLPVAAILRALQPPPEIRVAVLGIDASAVADEGTRSVKVFAEAPTGAEMARYVGFVSARRPFISAYLNKHEIVEAAAGRSFRFTLEVRWAD
ncbi:MAG: hypothetical protein LBS49_05805 [Candidatus Accumulibacter sp.]|nr:hypothetical protein [Accumulibacter sp.]